MINAPYFIAQIHYGEFWFHLHKPGDDCGYHCQEITPEQWTKAIEKIANIYKQQQTK